MRRRSFLKLGIMSPVFLNLGTLTALAAEDAGGESVLEEDERQLLGAIVKRMVETGEAHAPDPLRIGSLNVIDRVLRQLDEALVEELRLALRGVDYWPVLFEFRFARFRSLSAEDQDRSLDGWRTSSLAMRRRAFYALRNLSILSYWSRDETWPLIGYGGPWIRRPA